MPCYAVREVTQTLENIPDIKLLARGLQEMGFQVRLISETIAFSGVDKTTGMHQSGSYANGKLKTEEGLDLGALKKFCAVANVKKQIETHNSDKYKKVKLTLTQTGPFSYSVTKS